MAQTFTSAALVGGTGLVGSNILTLLLSHPSKPTIHALGRRDFPEESSQINSLISSDTSNWPASVKAISPPPPIFFSALGTTKGAAGSFAAQRRIDYDLNLELAKAAKEMGVKVYVLISVAGASASAMFPYTKMKGELEEEVKKLDFEYCVIVKPGLLVGDRQESRPAEAATRALANALGKISKGLTNWWAQDADAVARAAVNVGEICLDGKRDKGVWIIGQADIIRMGRKVVR